MPTAVRVEPDGIGRRRVEGWDRRCARAAARGAAADEPPSHKPGCGSRGPYDEHAGGLDELEDMFERGWSDGLPVVPPTPERVEAMLGGRDPEPLAGCGAAGAAARPRSSGSPPARCWRVAGRSYFPLVVAAVEAALDPAFNVHGIDVTTQPAAPIVIVNGPAREPSRAELGNGRARPGFAGQRHHRARAAAVASA